MESSKRNLASQAQGSLSKRANVSQSSESPNTPSSRSTPSQPSESSHVDSVGESPSMNTPCTGLTEAEANELLETLRRRSRSWVWDHYDRYVRRSGSSWDLRAKCLYCKKVDYACDTNSNGTKSLITHLEKCKEYPPNKEKVDSRQTILAFENPSKVAIGFSQKEITKACVEMVIMDELPFSFVEGNGFRRFCTTACPRWKVPCRQTIARDVINLYYSEKKGLRDMLRMHRVCITTDTWTSCQNINYMVITSHFIDANWLLHKKILSFCVIPNHKGDSIARLLEECLLDWGIEKILTITVDNASANDAGLSDLVKRVNRWQTSNSILLGGENFHVRCVAHILNLIVKDGLGELNSCVHKIRSAVRYTRSSPQRLEMFKSSVDKAKINSKGLVVLDVPTRWNSTYLMLNSALKFRSAFDRLKDYDSGYESYFFNDKTTGPPNEEDWRKAEMFANFLKPFYDITLRACCSTTPTIHHAFMDVFKIYCLLHEPNGIVDLDSIRKSMQSKYHKYWGDLEKVNKYFFISVVLDPRHKLEKVEDFFDVLYGDDITKQGDVENQVNGVKNLLMRIYGIYETNASIVGQKHNQSETSGGSDSSLQMSSDSEMSITSSQGEMRLLERSRLRKARKIGVIQSDIDRYLSDPIEGEEQDAKFDILNWWRVNGATKYPILSLIARDILPIPVSTIASESCFSTSGRIIDSFRSSLSPKMVEALICTQNWLRGNHVALNHEPTIEEVEFCESIEEEIAKDANTMPPPKQGN